MSTVVVVKKNGVAAIGADTMTKLGRSKQSAEYLKNSSKILKIGDSYIAYVGHASFGLVLSHYFKNLNNIPKLCSPEEIFEMGCNLHVALKENYFLNHTEEDDDEFESSQIQFLIANSSGIFGYHRYRDVDEYKKFYSFGSGDEYALGAMKTLYDTGATAEEIARAGIEAAAEFDDSTALPLEIYTVEMKLTVYNLC